MRSLKTAKAVLGLAVMALIALPACSSSSDSSSKWTDDSKPLRVWAENRPHSEILQHIVDAGLLPDGIKLDIKIAESGVDENDVVHNGDVDATYIDHIPFFEADTKQRGITDLQVGAKVHIEPQGLYSKRYHSLADIPKNAKIGIPDNVTNFARGLFLLQSAGLIKLDRSYDGGALSGDDLLITEKDVVSDPKNLIPNLIKSTDNTQLARQLQDVDAAVLQGNSALAVGLTPKTDALKLEDSKNGNPYVNVLVIPNALAKDKRVVALNKALESEDVAKFINDTYKGSVLPVHFPDAS
ncbi:MAG: MetQ/NlpA family ABC transporter substrate-binding protein [Gordonia sp. (in: high G+C Gram-positive bacteria)]